MQELPYSLMLDGSSDSGIEKMFPVTVQVINVKFQRVIIKFFDMNVIEGFNASTAEWMFQSEDNLLESKSTGWDYCMAIGLDNNNVKIGDHNSIKSRAQEKNENIIISGCPCQHPT